MLSCTCKNALVKVARGQGIVVARRDNGIRSMAVGDCYYQRIPSGYLVSVTHWFGSPADNDLESNSESNSD